MVDPRSALASLLEVELKKAGVMRDLRRMAMKISMSREEQDAKDLLANALARVIDPKVDPWRPGGHSFLAHMHRAMKKVRYLQRRKRVAEVVFDGGLAQESAANDGPRADDELEHSHWLESRRRLGEHVVARLEPSD